MISLTEVYQSQNSRINFMKGCIRIAKCDGLISEIEQEFFTTAGKNLGIDETNINLLNSLMKNCDENISINFETKKQSLFFFRESIQLCYLDGKYDKNEKKEILKIAKELKITNSEIIKIENWVTDGLEWIKKGDKLLSELEGK